MHRAWLLWLPIPPAAASLALLLQRGLGPPLSFRRPTLGQHVPPLALAPQIRGGQVNLFLVLVALGALAAQLLQLRILLVPHLWVTSDQGAAGALGQGDHSPSCLATRHQIGARGRLLGL